MSNYQRIILLAMLAVMIPIGLAQAQPIDLSTWTPYILNVPGGQADANWVLSGDNSMVTQTVNADPSYFMNNQAQSEYQITGSWRCTTSSDDDFIGFTFGWQDPAHCYIMDWKKNTQSGAQEGFSIKKLAAPSEADLVSDDFWLSAGTGHTETLATNYSGTAGWVTNVLYHFTLSFSPGNFRVIVKEGDLVLWDITVLDSTYPDGEFGFYNFSQGSVEYSGFIQNEYPVCDAGGPYGGGAGVPITFDGSNSFDPDADGMIVSWEWDFGDGNTGSGPTPTHTYAEDGDYMVSLCVIDNLGATSCCEASEPVVPTEERSWGSLKSQYR